MNIRGRLNAASAKLAAASSAVLYATGGAAVGFFIKYYHFIEVCSMRHLLTLNLLSTLGENYNSLKRFNRCVDLESLVGEDPAKWVASSAAIGLGIWVVRSKLLKSEPVPAASAPSPRG